MSENSQRSKPMMDVSFLESSQQRKIHKSNTMYKEQMNHRLQTTSHPSKVLATNEAASTGCGKDRACPKSVTQLSSKVSLDHYQLGSIRRQSRHFNPIPRISSRGDENFSWYDLDAIRRSRSIRADHDASAGLIFTTQRQILKQKAETNHFVDPSLVTNKSDHGPVLDSLVFWTIQKIGFGDNNSDISNSQDTYNSQESLEDREFSEQIRSLEREVYNNCTVSRNFRGYDDEDANAADDSTSVSSSFSSL